MSATTSNVAAPMRGRIWSADDAIAAVRMRRQGLSAREIALKLGRATDGVKDLYSALRRRHGIPVPLHKPGRKPLPLDTGRIAALRKAGWSMDRIAADLGASRDAVRRRMREMGL